MALFDKFNSFARTFSEKTNDVIESGRLSARAASERSAAAEELKKIGEYYYHRFAAGEEVAQEVTAFCRSAQNHFNAAAEAQAQLDRLQEEKDAARAEAEAREAAEAAANAPGTVCPACGAKNALEMRFCSQCGEKLETAGYCPGCGTKYEAGTRFCGDCGQKI